MTSHPINIILRQDNTQSKWGYIKIVSTSFYKGENKPDFSEFRFDLHGQEITLSREQSNETALRLNGQDYTKVTLISRSHFSIIRDGNSAIIRDLKSTNGVLLNGIRIDESSIWANDLITVQTGCAASVGYGQPVSIAYNDHIKSKRDYKNDKEWKNAVMNDLPDSISFRIVFTDHNMMKSYLDKAKVPSSVQVENSKRKFQQDDDDISESHKKALTSACFDNFGCSICKNTLIEPHSLQCGHTFCYSCLSGHLERSKTCPQCRKLVLHPSSPNTPLKAIIQAHIDNLKDKSEFESRISVSKAKENNEVVKLTKLIDQAKRNKIGRLNILEPWSVANKRTFQNIKSYNGTPREIYMNYVGLTEELIEKCSNTELIRICSNLGIPLSKGFFGQTVETMRCLTDFEATRKKLFSFWHDKNNVTIK